MKKVLYGAGYRCHKAISEYGKNNIELIIDNDHNKIGKKIDGIPIISWENYKKSDRNKEIIVTPFRAYDIVKQLVEQGFKCRVYREFVSGFYPEDVLVYDTYYSHDAVLTEEQWISENKESEIRNYINASVLAMSTQEKEDLFEAVEIETYNRCNGGCEFCPVNKLNDSRPERKMGIELFQKIIQDLQEIDYGGKLSLFSNNEPFLDERIIDMHKYARERLPKARIHLFTNGTLLTVEKVEKLLPYLDELIIDNYNVEKRLIPSVQNIKDYFEKDENVIRKMTIVYRNPKEVLTSRGGDAPNRSITDYASEDSCLLPFRQLIIRPDGKVSLCCNDPLGKVTMGDCNKNTLEEIWYGKTYKHYRERIKQGRCNLELCRNCDTFYAVNKMIKEN